MLKFTKSSPCNHFRVYYTLTTAEGYKHQNFKDFDDIKTAKSFAIKLHNSGQEVLFIRQLSFFDYLITEAKDNE